MVDSIAVNQNREALMEKFHAPKLQVTDYEVLATLRTGFCGRTRLARNKKTGEHAAIKILKKADIIKAKQIDNTIAGVTTLSAINHPFLVGMIGYAQDERFLYIMTEFLPGGDVYTYLEKSGKLENKETVFVAAQVVCMFEYLHSKNILYRNLKPENLLIASDGYIKLTDFDFAKIIDGRTYTLCGTPEYFAPEILLGKGYGKPVDWWGLGILIYELLLGTHPFSAEDVMVVYQKINSCKPKFPKDFDKNAKNLIELFLVPLPTKRLGNLKDGINDIKRHRWFADVDWDGIQRKEMRPLLKPSLKSSSDTSHYPSYPDSKEPPEAIDPKEDPFASW